LEQTADFLCWLYRETQPKAWEGHVLLTLIRSKGLKEKLGFKGSDHSLGLRWIPGYLTPFEKWFSRALSIVLTEAWRADYVPNVYWKYGREPIPVPPELISIMISPNPGKWLKSAHKACAEFHDGVTAVLSRLLAGEGASIEELENQIHRPDVRLPAYMMKHQRKVLAQIDIDSKDREVLRWVLERIPSTGAIRAVLETPHGYHLLVRLDMLSAEEAKKLWRGLSRDVVREELGDERLVELKTHFQEPVPGLRYQGSFVVKFSTDISSVLQ
jgi:hypothetical protein